MLSPKMGLRKGSDPAEGAEAEDAAGAAEGVGWPDARVTDAATHTNAAI